MDSISLKGLAATMLVLALAACGASEERSAPSTTTTAAAAEAEAATGAYDPTPLSSTIPDDPAGRQLRWFLEAIENLPIAETDIEAHFAASMLAVLPPDQLNASLAQTVDESRFRFVGVVTSTGERIDAAIVGAADQPKEVLSLSVDADGKVTGVVPKPYPLRSRQERALDPLTLPAPTGPDEVGTDTIVVTDGSRDGRRIPVQLWYPAAGGTGDGPAPYAPPATAATLAEVLAVPDEDVASIRTNALTGAEPARADEGRPVVIFSPGYGVIRTFYSGYGVELASHGYVVAVLDHPGDGSLVEFPDGTTVPGDVPTAGGFDPEAWLATRVADGRAVLDELQRLDAAPDGRFHDSLDLERVAFAGHSLGGATAAEAMRIDPRFDVGVNLDGSMLGGVVETGLDRPFLLVSSDGADDESWTAFQGRTATARWMVIDGTAHMAYSDRPALSALRPAVEQVNDPYGIGTIEPTRSAAVQTAYLVAFLDHHLQGGSGTLLDGPSDAYPEVQFR